MRSEIETKFGLDSAEAIILRKMNDEKLRETEIKKHPDLPDSIDMMQFLIFDSEVEIDQEEEVMEMLYKLAEAAIRVALCRPIAVATARKRRKTRKNKTRNQRKHETQEGLT